jgi:hypothetical protein
MVGSEIAARQSSLPGGLRQLGKDIHIIFAWTLISLVKDFYPSKLVLPIQIGYHAVQSNFDKREGENTRVKLPLAR